MNAVRPATTESALSDAPWPRVKLGEMCEFSADGDWIESKDQALSGIRLIQTGNIGNGRFENKAEKSRFVSEDTFSRLHCTEIFPGDVLVSRLPDPVGRACKLSDIGQRMITAVDCTILRFKDVVDSDFFILYSQSPDYRLQIESFITGSTRARISRKNLEQISIPLPPLSVQRSIVARLDAELARADRMREQFLALAESAVARFRAILAETFEQGENGDSWPHVRLGEIGRVVTGSTPSTSHKEFYGGKWPLFKPTDLNAGLETCKAADSLTDAGWACARHLPVNSVLVTCIGTIGKVGVIRTAGTCNQQINAIVPEKAVAEYLYYAIIAPSFQKTLLAESNATTLAIINKAKFETLSIPLPPLSVQRSFVARLDAARVRRPSLPPSAPG